MIDMQIIISAITAIIAALIAIWNEIKKREAIAETTQVAMAYTPGTVESKTPEIIAKLPERSWRMNEATRRYLVFDATPANSETILDQVKDAENQCLTHYQIHFDGGYYVIDYGLLMGGAGNPSGK